MQKEAREKIKNLVAKYEAEKAIGKISKYSEEETKRGFIEPLFQALGWDFSNKGEITLEEQISGDRVDYGFYLNGRIKFYLEAKPRSKPTCTARIMPNSQFAILGTRASLGRCRLI